MMTGVVALFHTEGLVAGSALVDNSEQRLHAVLTTLEDCQATLVVGGDRDTAQLLSVAILELRIKLHRIDDSELKTLCDAMVREAETCERPRAQGASPGHAPFTLRLVK